MKRSETEICIALLACFFFLNALLKTKITTLKIGIVHIRGFKSFAKNQCSGQF